MKINLVFISAVLIVCLCACVETINLDPSSEKKVVVNCILTSQKVQKLTLNYSALPSSNYYEEIAQATIILFENDKAVGEFHKTGYSQWELDYSPKAGLNYRLSVEISGHETITATTFFPHRTPIQRLKQKDEGGKRYFEKGSTGVFWAFAFEKQRDTMMRVVRIDPSFMLMSTIGTDYPALDNFNQRASLSVYEGLKGNFAYLRMLPYSKTNQFYLEKLYSCVVVFRAVSDEYDQYLKTSLTKMLVYESFYDPSQWMDECDIYSNIENGVGIFGAYSDLLFNFNLSMPDSI